MKLWRLDFQIINGIVYKHPVKVEHCTRMYLPETLRPGVLKLVHSHAVAGHPRSRKICQTVTCNYFWPRYSIETKTFVENYEVWHKHKGVVNRPAPLEKYLELLPCELVSMDFMCPFPIVDKWMQTYSCSCRFSHTVFWNCFCKG